VLVDFNDSVKGALTTKAFEYVSNTSPILLIGGDEQTVLASLIRRTQRGVICQSDEAQIMSCLKLLLNGQPVLNQPPNTDVIRQYTRRAQAMRLYDRLTDLSGHGTPAATS